MAKFEKQLVWPCHWEEVYDRVVVEPARTPDVVRAMKDVKDAKVVKNEWEDGRHHVWLEMESDAKIPRPILALIPGGKITWIQAGIWHPETRQFHVEVDPHMEKREVDVFATYQLEEHRQGTLMSASLRVNAKIPFLGGLIEKLVISKVSTSVLGYYEGLIRQMG